MKLLIDMNLSPDWRAVFEQQGWQAVHWSTEGDPCALDQVIMDWARENGYVVFTHDLDFGTLPATTRAQGTERYSGSYARHYALESGEQVGEDTSTVRVAA